MNENLMSDDGSCETITTTRDKSTPTLAASSATLAASGSTEAPVTTPPAAAPVKALKRCLSVPITRTVPSGAATMTTRTRSAAAAAVANSSTGCAASDHLQDTPKKYQYQQEGYGSSHNSNCMHIGIPRSNPSSREVSPAPVFNIFAPRARRYSASYSPLGATVATHAGGAGAATGAVAPLCITPRVSQLRQEECVDMNSREVNHEREVHSAMQMSQSWEDLTLVAENWSCKSDEFSNPLQVVLPSGVSGCSSPSPTSNRAGLRLPYGLSPSPTRRTFATRRSMSPIAMRPSQLGPVKRKFELDDNNSSNWNVYSSPPLKKIFTESRGSPPSSVCPSPDSGTYDGRSTPKLFVSKLCTTNTNNNSTCSSPSSGIAIDSAATSTLCSSSSSSSSSASSISGGSEPMCIGSNLDEGISISENYDKLSQCPSGTSMATVATAATDIQDEAAMYTMMDDMRSETSSVGGCSSISSAETPSCSEIAAGVVGAKIAATNFPTVDDVSVGGAIAPLSTISLGQKHFFINKQSVSGARKFVVNHDHLPVSNSEPHSASINVCSNATATRSASQHHDKTPMETDVIVTTSTGVGN